MTSSSSSSRAATPVPLSICRCCLTEGCDKDMMSQYQCDGVEEVYADMLKETFDVEFLLPAEDNSTTKHICDNCIIQLRQAFQFKHRTIRSAMKFQQHVDKLNATRGGNTKKQKEEEANVSEDHNTDNESECFSVEALDEDDDEPTKTQSENKSSTLMKRKMSMETEYDHKIAKVEESGDIINVEPRDKLRGDILSQLESNLWSQGTNISVKPVEPKDKPSERKNNEPNKAKLSAPRGVMSFTKKDGHSNAAKKTAKTSVKRDKSIVGSETDPADLTVAEDNMIPDNILMLLEWSNMCLFHYNTTTTTRSREKGIFKCYFCTETFPNLKCLRAHTESHDKADMIIKLLRSNINCVILVEISYLMCKCGARCETLSHLMNHLTDIHKVPFEVKSLDNLETYKVAQNGLVCDWCEVDAFEYFGRLRRHVRDIHIKDSIDMFEECGKVFKGARTATQMKALKKLDHAAEISARKKRKCKKNNYQDNIITLVSNSTACPFHWPTEKTKPYKCYCCHLHYNEMKELRHHFTSIHDMAKFRIEMTQQICKTPLKLDITDLKCTNCEEPCDDLDILRTHLSERHDIACYEEKKVITLKIESEGYKCLVCQDIFEGWVQLNRHMRVSGCVPMSPNKFECADCGRSFVGKKTWQTHMKNLHSEDNKNNMMPVTALRANTKTLLDHSNMTIFIFDDVRFRCFSCHETFVHFPELMAHNDTHDTKSVVSIMKLAKNTRSTHSYNIKADITDLKCNVCQNAFEQIDEFQKHLAESHQVIFYRDGKHFLMPYMVSNGLKCGFCKQCFLTSQSLIRHVNSHAAGSGEVCDQCGKSFINAYQLRKHKRRIHSEIKCAVCNITFANYKAKQTHNKNHHNHNGRRQKRIRFMCGFCKTIFSSAESKYRHMKEGHGYQTPELKCDHCDKVFCTKGAYKSHIAIHTKIKMFPCKHCPNSFLPENLEAHIQQSHKEALTSRCYVCRSKFASADLLCDHLVDSHSNNATYCPMCEYLPEDIESLLSHLRIDHKLDNMLDVEWTAVKRKIKGRKSVSRGKNVKRHEADEVQIACVQIEELL